MVGFISDYQMASYISFQSFLHVHSFLRGIELLALALDFRNSWMEGTWVERGTSSCCLGLGCDGWVSWLEGLVICAVEDLSMRMIWVRHALLYFE